MNKKACVVVLYNPDHEVIENMYNHSRFFDILVVVDNTDNESLVIDPAFTNIVYLPQFANLGLPAGFNIGVSYLLERGFSKAMLLDQDTVLQDNSDDYFAYSFSAPNDIAVIGPLYSIDRSKRKIVLSNSSTEIKFSMTSGCIFDLTAFEKLGGFDEKLFLDSLDAEYCVRARKNGYRVVRYNGYCVKHRPAITKTTKILRIKYGYCAPVRVYYQNRNGYYCWHQYKDWLFIKGILKRYFKIFFFFPQKRLFLKMMKRGKLDEKKGVFGAYKETNT